LKQGGGESARTWREPVGGNFVVTGLPSAFANDAFSLATATICDEQAAPCSAHTADRDPAVMICVAHTADGDATVMFCVPHTADREANIAVRGASR